MYFCIDRDDILYSNSSVTSWVRNQMTLEDLCGFHMHKVEVRYGTISVPRLFSNARMYQWYFTRITSFNTSQLRAAIILSNGVE